MKGNADTYRALAMAKLGGPSRQSQKNVGGRNCDFRSRLNLNSGNSKDDVGFFDILVVDSNERIVRRFCVLYRFFSENVDRMKERSLRITNADTPGFLK